MLKGFLFVDMVAILAFSLARTMRDCINTCEGPNLCPELGEALNGPIIQIIIILQCPIIFLVDELQEIPHVTRCGVLVFPEGELLVTGPRGLHGGRMNGGLRGTKS